MQYPKILHFIWLGEQIPDKYYRAIKLAAKLNIGYQVNIYIDTGINGESPIRETPELNIIDVAIHKDFVWFINNPAYNDWLNGEDKSYTFASNLLRLVILYMYGGIYCDVDITMHYKIPNYNLAHGILVPGAIISNNILLHDNYFIIASRGNFYIKKCYDYLCSQYHDHFFLQKFTDTEYILNRYNTSTSVFLFGGSYIFKFLNDLVTGYNLERKDFVIMDMSFITHAGKHGWSRKRTDVIEKISFLNSNFNYKIPDFQKIKQEYKKKNFRQCK